MSEREERVQPPREDEKNPRKGTDARPDGKLPVTGEVGSEGGSYTDATNQVAEFEGDIGRTAEAAGPLDADAETADSIKPANE